MKIRLIAILILLLPASALPDPVDLSCTLPTQNTDGSALTDLKDIRFYESTVSGGPYFLIKTNDPPVCAYSFERTAGTYYYVATATNEQDVESADSGQATKVVPPPAPAPPTNLVVIGDLVAYGSQQSDEVQTTYPVGTVPDGTPCDPSMSANGKYRVPKSAVIWVGTVRPAVVFAECGAG